MKQKDGEPVRITVFPIAEGAPVPQMQDVVVGGCCDHQLSLSSVAAKVKHS